MVYKKELVDTGCENKHQTCKDCLDKIKQKNNKCPFCREKLVAQVEIGISLVMSQTGCTRNVARNVLNDNDGDVALSIMDINGENEDMNRLSIMDINGENDNDGITMHMENMRETYPSRRYTRREREEEEEYTRREREEEEEEDRRDHMEDRIESMRDRRESMRERARENRAR
jgi:NACalpha-BTF3-like transcription factor